MRIAIVGTGISGLLAARLLSREHEIDVFERDKRIGGHTHTHVLEEDGRKLAIDSGFIVFNHWTYPNFTRLLEQLGVASKPSDMSFGVRCEHSGLEYNGTSLNALFAQRTNLLRPSFLWMIRDILRFNREALALLESGEQGLTLEQFLRRGRFGTAFREHYLLPMASAVWSAPPEGIGAFPARTFAQFFKNHGFLSVDQRPVWRVLTGGSASYLAPLCAPFAERIRTGVWIESIRREPGRVLLRLKSGERLEYDAVVIAAHSDQALALLADPSAEEREILGAIRYQDNEALLHTDERLLPRKPLARAAWNYHIASRGLSKAAQATLTYWMNRLQSFESRRQYLVTLNHSGAVDPRLVLRRMRYQHPQFTLAAIAAQQAKARISGVRRTYYCGAYWGFGFHEDGVNSALDVGRHFGQELEPRQRSLQAAAR